MTAGRVLDRIGAGLIVGLICAALLIASVNTGFFAQAQLRATNNYYVPLETSGEIVIVALDDMSLGAYGRSPTVWSRALYADLIQRLAAARARVVAFDIIFSESEPEDAAVAESMRDARSSDSRTRFVMAAAGVEALPNRSALTEYPKGIALNDVLQPNSTLRNALDYIGYVNTFPDVDSAIRRQTSVIDYNGALEFSFPLTVYLAYLRIPAEAAGQVVVQNEDGLFVTPQRQLNVDDFGLWMNNYFGPPAQGNTGKFPMYSFKSILDGAVDPAVFEDKIVLVGLANSTGAIDRYLVPSSDTGLLMAGVEIHANAVETLLQGNALTPQAYPGTVVMIVLAAGLIGLGSAGLIWYAKLVLWAAAIVGSIVAASFIFSQYRIVVNALYMWLSLSLPVLVLIGLEVSLEISKRVRSEFLLQSISEMEQQRLLLDRIWALIASDVREIAPRAHGAIYTREGDAIRPVQLIGSGEGDAQLQRLAERVIRRPEVVVERPYCVYPIVWQDTVHGAIAVALPGISFRQRHVIRDFSRRIAPGVANALLYEEVRRQNAVQATIFTNIPAAIAVLDDKLTTNQWNAVFKEIVQQERARGDFLEALTWQGIAPKALDEIRTEFQTKEVVRREIALGSRTFALVASPLTGLQSWVVILSDVTQLVELNRLKTQMIRMASHDLKNPLSRVVGFADLILMDDDIPQQKREFVEHIMMSADEMLQIISDILDLEQLRSGVPSKETIDFVRLCREVSARHKPDFAGKEQAFEVVLPDVPVVIQGSYLHLSQAVSNLLSNASKYTPRSGHISLKLSSEGGKLRLDVQDDGIGISESGQAKLFSEFYRVKTKSTEGIPGAGLGLSLVKSVVEMHDGRVSVRSVEGQGSTFSIELPVMTE